MNYRSIILGTAMLSVVSSADATAQNAAVVTAVVDSARRLIDAGNFADSVHYYATAQAMLERARVVAPKDRYVLHYLGYCFYRQGVDARGRRDAAAAEADFTKAEELLVASANEGSIPENYALLGLVFAQRAASGQAAAMKYGRRISEEVDMGVRVGPKNPRVWLTRGIVALNTPAEYGGGLDRAQEMLETAMELFAKDHPKGVDPDWGYAEVHAWLGQLYERRGDRPGAAKIYADGLRIEPRYRWIKEVLLRRASGETK